MKTLKSILLLLAICCTILSTQSCKGECEDIVCQNGGICEDGTCQCPGGFSGENCENEDLCFSITCENGGTCVEGTCDCPDGFLGEDCGIFDSAKVQVLLNNGKTPKEIFDGNVPLDSLYGKMYLGGLIFYLNTTDGTGMVAAIADQGSGVEWGCSGNDIADLNNIPDCPGMNNCGQPISEDTFEGARIGDGMANTDAIIAGCLTDGIAARLCRNLGEEWFLPSRGELNKMYTNLLIKGHSEFVDDLYWSSTEYTPTAAWGQLLTNSDQSSINGELNFDGKEDYAKPVRAARAF